MKRSEINRVHREALDCFDSHGWVLPPNPCWDITDFGLGDFPRFGLTLINLAEEPEYCEKLMYARPGQTTPAHTHRLKKEDIICRHGVLELRLWEVHPDQAQNGSSFKVQVNGCPRIVVNGEFLILGAGERITLSPGIYHEFRAGVPDTILGEVSTANDDAHDNYFVNPDIGRFPGIEEDEPAEIHLVSEEPS